MAEGTVLYVNTRNKDNAKEKNVETSTVNRI